jgi:hypothetical protein
LRQFWSRKAAEKLSENSDLLTGFNTALRHELLGPSLLACLRSQQNDPVPSTKTLMSRHVSDLLHSKPNALTES